MDPQEKLEAMFCPRLDSALVASIFHDMADFNACIPILSALADSASPAGASTSASTSAPVSSNPIKTIITSSARKTTPQPSTTHKSAAVAKEKNIMIWSDDVASSNPPTKPTGIYKSAPTASKTAFRAVRNPNYLRKQASLQELASELSNDGIDQEEDVDSEEASEQDNTPEEPVSTFTQPQQPARAESKSRKAKQQQRRKQNGGSMASPASVPSASSTTPTVDIPRRTWKKDQNGRHGIAGQELEQIASLDLSNKYDTKEDLCKDDPAEAEKDDFGTETSSVSSSQESFDRNGVKAEELAFLTSCFPDREHSDEYLTQVLKDCRRDLEAAVEMILSQMFLENEQVETSSSGSGSLHSSASLTTATTGTSSLDDHFFQGVQKSKKKLKAGGSGGSVWDKGSAQLTPQQQAAFGMDVSDPLLRMMDCQDEFLIPESNEWATFEHQISILMNIFHTVPRKTIVSEYHANAAHLFKTVESLEARLKRENHAGSAAGRQRQSDFDLALAQLVEMFPDHGPSGLKNILVYNAGNFQDAMNAVLAADFALAENGEQGLRAGSASSSSKKQNVIPFKADIRIVDKKTANGGTGLRNTPSNLNPFPNGPRLFPNTILDNSNADLYVDDDDPDWCRQRAHETLDQRNELFRRAAKAYQATKGKGAGMGGIAAYYADEGKKLDAQGKQWHMRAARAVVHQHRLENNDPNLVDLHGLTIAEAQTVVKEAVTQWFSRATMQASRIAAKPLKIICGVGSHSKDRIARLYPTILNLLQKDGWRVEAENGVILVKGVSRIMPAASGKR